MKLTKDDLFLNVNIDNFIGSYESFIWLDKNILKKKNLLITSFGDLIFEDKDKKIYFLDLIEGKIIEIAENISELQKNVNTKEFQQDLLLSNLLEALKEKGLSLSQGQVYSFNVPMVLGGETVLDNVEIIDLSVWIHIIGQIHNQVKNLKPGTKIDKITIAD